MYAKMDETPYITNKNHINIHTPGKMQSQIQFNIQPGSKAKKWCGGYVISSSYDSSCWPYLHHLASSTHSKDLLGLGKKENHTSTIGFYEIMHCKTPTSLLTVSLEISQAALEVFSVTSARKSQPHQHAVCCHHPGAKKNSTKTVAPHKRAAWVRCLFTTCFFQRHGVKICHGIREFKTVAMPYMLQRVLVIWFATYSNLSIL